MFAKLLTLFTVASVAGMGVYGLQHIDDAQPKPATVSAAPAPPQAPPPALNQPPAPRQVMPPGGSDGSLPANAYFAQYPQWKFWVVPVDPASPNSGWVYAPFLGMPHGWKYWRAVYLYAYCPTGTGEPNLGTKWGAWQYVTSDAGGTTYRLVPTCYDAKVSLP